MTHRLVELREESIFSPLFFIFLEHFILRHDVSDILCTTTQEYQELVKVVQEKAGDSSDEAEEVRKVLVDSIFYFLHVSGLCALGESESCYKGKVKMQLVD